MGCELECDASTPSRQPSHIFQADESRSCNRALGFYFTDALLSLFFLPPPPPPPLSVVLRAVWLCLHKPCPYTLHFVRQTLKHHDRNTKQLGRRRCLLTFEAALFLSVGFSSSCVTTCLQTVPVHLQQVSSNVTAHQNHHGDSLLSKQQQSTSAIIHMERN